MSPSYNLYFVIYTLHAQICGFSVVQIGQGHSSWATEKVVILSGRCMFCGGMVMSIH